MRSYPSRPEYDAMAKRNNRRKRANRGSLRTTTVPGSTITQAWSGTIASNATISMVFNTNADDLYRVNSGLAQLVSAAPTQAQFKLRGESDQEEHPSALHLVSPQQKTLRVTIPANEGFWTATGSDRVGWISNLGDTPLRYIATVRMTRRMVLSPVARLNVEERLPDSEVPPV